MSELSGAVEYAFVRPGALALECKGVLRAVLIPERHGAWECPVDLDSKIGLSETILDAEQCRDIGAYLARHSVIITRHSPIEEGRLLGDRTFWFARIKDDEVVTVVEMPVEQLGKVYTYPEPAPRDRRYDPKIERD